jgi:hypothetical protein
MEQAVPTILPADLDTLLGAALAPVVVELRSAEQISAADRLIPGAIGRSPVEVLEQGTIIYDALNTWCRFPQAAMHNWPAAGRGGAT